ncbi:acyltransferase [Archangium violaceum]|uniref:acyltransferase n=1 Tax=Archangium violaceum TaxID=83451 RepID=UPI002B29CF6F|nr:acyltransferase [Archangium gephyra]
MDATLNPVRRAVFRLAETGAVLSALHHRARLPGAEHLPARGPVLLVGNHGLWGYETPAFFHLIHRATGRYPSGLAERGFFKVPLVRTVLPWLGGVEGTRDNALASLRQGHLVVCYPGGAWETFKKPRHHYTPRWEGTVGFGVDGTFLCPDDERWCVPLAPGEKYRVPLGVGLGPFPLPVKMTFAVGPALKPPPADAPESRSKHFRDRLAALVGDFLARHDS